jgi:hypothetical protein
MQQLSFAPHETETTLPRVGTTGRIGNHAASAQAGYKQNMTSWLCDASLPAVCMDEDEITDSRIHLPIDVIYRNPTFL